MSLKATSLWQPWATGMATGMKFNETRGFATKHRGDLAIHAAKRWKFDQRMIAANFRRLGELGFGLPFGAIVAVVRVIDVISTDQVTLTDREERWGNYAPGRYAWVTTELRPLADPVACVGQQGMWTLDPAIEAAVRAQLLPNGRAG